jgi:hypothetical protein
LKNFVGEGLMERAAIPETAIQIPAIYRRTPTRHIPTNFAGQPRTRISKMGGTDFGGSTGMLASGRDTLGSIGEACRVLGRDTAPGQSQALCRNLPR